MNPNITKYEADHGSLSVRLKLRDNLRPPLNDMNDRWLRFSLNASVVVSMPLFFGSRLSIPPENWRNRMPKEVRF